MIYIIIRSQKVKLIFLNLDLDKKYQIKLTLDPNYLQLYDFLTKRTQMKVYWIGWIGLDIDDKYERDYIKKKMYAIFDFPNISFNEYNCVGVFV